MLGQFCLVHLRRSVGYLSIIISGRRFESRFPSPGEIKRREVELSMLLSCSASTADPSH